MRRPLLLAAVLAASAGTATDLAIAGCPGGAPSCPYTGSGQVGQRSGGVLRFPQAVAVAPDGTVYVGDQGSHVIHVFNADGTFRREIGRPGTKSGQITAVGALAVARDGSLLVADGRNRIMRFAADGRLLAEWGRTGSSTGEFRFGGGRGNDAGAGGGLAVSGDHVFVADSGNDRIQRFDLSGGHGATIVPAGRLRYPKGVAARGHRLFVADNQHHRVLVMDDGGRLLRTIRTTRRSGRRTLSHPYGVTVGPRGRVFVADNLNHRVVRFSTRPTYPYKGRWGGFGTQAGRLAYPRAVATGPRGLVYVANTGNDRVDVFDRGGRLLRSIGRSGRAAGQFNTPLGAAADPAGYRAVTDAINGRIQLLAPDGTVAAVWGSPNPGPTILQRPTAMVFDGAGNAYVLDRRRGRVYVFSRTRGVPMRSIGRPGSGPGELNDPSAIAMDAAGTMYIADTGNRRIARFAVDGRYLGAIEGAGSVRGVAVTSDAGRIYAAASDNRISVYARDGLKLDWFGGTGRKLGKLNVPAQITLDGDGNLWVADRGNGRVQKFGPAGERLATFGARGTGPGEFLKPTGVALDCRGTLTVTDTDNNRVQQFALAAAPPAACAQLPPPATPPAPKSPTLPPPDGPAVTLRVLRIERVLSTGNVPIRLGCDASCRLEVTAVVAERRERRPLRVRARVRAKLGAGASRVLRLRLSRGERRRLARRLGRRRGLTAQLRVTATGSFGTPTSRSRALRLTR
jgi:DNA-binding beta-propeller fold protein YncE